MTRIVLDETTLTKFKGVRDDAELCDAAGKVVGYFTPLGCNDDSARGEPEFTREEWERRMQGPWYTTAEVLAHLRGLKCSP